MLQKHKEQNNVQSTTNRKYNKLASFRHYTHSCNIHAASKYQLIKQLTVKTKVLQQLSMLCITVTNCNFTELFPCIFLLVGAYKQQQHQMNINRMVRI